MNVLSLFDGMSCGQIALEKAGFKVDNYFASEIDKHSISVTQHNYPKTVQLGDVKNWKKWELPKIDILIAGSPCQGFSNAGKGLNFKDPRSKLFFEFVKILKHLRKNNPEILFLLENVKMKGEWRDVISKYLKVNPVEINSNLVSAQTRKRLYWTNISKEITQPEDKKIFLKDILQETFDEKYILSEKQFNYVTNNIRLKKKFTALNGEKALSLMAGYNRLQGTFLIDMNGSVSDINNDAKTGTLSSRYYKGIEAYGSNPFLLIQEATKKGYVEIYPEEGVDLTFPFSKTRRGRRMKDKSNALQTSVEFYWYNGLNCRKLTPLECERLQTVPDNYTSSVSDSQRYKMLGNGWTIDVISHIFSYMSE